MDSLVDAGEIAKPFSGWQQSKQSGGHWEVANSATFQNPSVTEGNKNQSIKDSLMYVGMDPHAFRIEEKNAEKEKKNGMAKN